MATKTTVIHDRKSRKVKRNKKHDGGFNLFGGETVESLKSERDKLKKQLNDEKNKKEERKRSEDERTKKEDERKKKEDERKKSKEIDKLLEDEQKQKIKEEIYNLKNQIKEVKYPGSIPKQDSKTSAVPVVIDSDDFFEKTDKNSLPPQMVFPVKPIYPTITNADIIVEAPKELSNKMERTTKDTSVFEIATSFVLFGGFLTGVIVLLNDKN